MIFSVTSTPKKSTINESKLHVTIHETSFSATDSKQFVPSTPKERNTSQTKPDSVKFHTSTPKHSKMNADPIQMSASHGKMSLRSPSTMLR